MLQRQATLGDLDEQPLPETELRCDVGNANSYIAVCCIVACCIVVCCIAVCCIVAYHTETFCIAFCCVATCCTAALCTAACCIAWTVWCNYSRLELPLAQAEPTTSI